MSTRHGLRWWVGLGVAVVVLLAVVAILLHNLGGGDGFSLVDEASGDWAYLAVFLLVVGDAMLDRYWHGAVERISPEAPVPVVKVSRRNQLPLR